MKLQISECRRHRNYTPTEIVLRVLWALTQPAFRWPPRIMWGWRNLVLRAFVATLGRRVRIDPSARIFAPWQLSIGDDTSIGWDATLYNLGPMQIGSRVTISQGAHLCGGTHDFRDPEMPLQRMPLSIEDEVWVCADVFIGPGVTVRSRAVVGARAVVTRDVPSDVVVAGNPAVEVNRRLSVGDPKDAVISRRVNGRGTTQH